MKVLNKKWFISWRRKSCVFVKRSRRVHPIDAGTPDSPVKPSKLLLSEIEEITDVHDEVDRFSPESASEMAQIPPDDASSVTSNTSTGTLQVSIITVLLYSNNYTKKQATPTRWEGWRPDATATTIDFHQMMKIDLLSFNIYFKIKIK